MEPDASGPKGFTVYASTNKIDAISAVGSTDGTNGPVSCARSNPDEEHERTIAARSFNIIPGTSIIPDSLHNETIPTSTRYPQPILPNWNTSDTLELEQRSRESVKRSSDASSSSETFSILSSRHSCMDYGERKELGSNASVSLLPDISSAELRSGSLQPSSTDITSYLPDSQLSVFVVSWNMADTVQFTNEVSKLLMPPEVVNIPDIYVVGTQESTSRRREWMLAVQQMLWPAHVLVSSSTHGVLCQDIFVRKELIWFCTDLEESFISFRSIYRIKTKGVVYSALTIFGTRFLFLNSHFFAGERHLARRIENFIAVKKHFLKDNSDFECDAWSSVADRIIWYGDLNFRTDMLRIEVDQLMKKSPFFWECLVNHDQLSRLRLRDIVFPKFQELPLNFPPSYKFDSNSDIYDSSAKQRTPSWTDRILYYSKDPKTIFCVRYTSNQAVLLSDHRPVYGIFQIAVGTETSRPIGELVHFCRELYDEASRLRRSRIKKGVTSALCSVM